MTMANPAATNGVKPIRTSKEVNPFADLEPDTDTDGDDNVDDNDQENDDDHDHSINNSSNDDVSPNSSIFIISADTHLSSGAYRYIVSNGVSLTIHHHYGRR